jgi:RNA polymerase sigma factor (sigma-70 family)
MGADRRPMISENAKRQISDWFRQWRSPLRRFLGKAGVPAADIDDVAQEVFLRLMRYERAELIVHPQAYLFKVAFHVAAEWSIRACNKRPHEHNWLTNLIDDEQADSPLVQAQSREEVERALTKLSPHQRELLKLFFADELSYGEIATQLGESLRSVRRQFEKSYDRLRHELDPELLRVITHGRD